MYLILILFLILNPSPLFGLFLSDIYFDKFKESLKIKVLPTGNIYTHLEFEIIDIDLSNNTRFFPRSLSEILITHSVQELHLSLTQGHWMVEQWGDHPIITSSAPGGAQIIAWFNAKNKKAADDNWKGFTSRLSGLTCASFNFLDNRNSITPVYAYRPNGKFQNSSSAFVRVGSLPKENVCTENLTPWTKLLPTGVVRGLSSLLRSKQVFNTHYHSAAVHFTKSDHTVQLLLTISLVFDSINQIKHQSSTNFVRKTFGSPATFPCSLSSNSKIEIWNPEIEVWKGIDPKGLNSLKISELPRPLNTKPKLIFTPLKYMGGYGQEYGEIIIEMRNHLSDRYLPVLYVEVLPWFIRPFLHTIKIKTTPSNINNNNQSNSVFNYMPGRDREVLHKLEMNFILPPNSTTRLSFTVEKRHLRWDEYPPDANHGFYLESSHFEVNYNDVIIYYYSRKLLVNLSTPDFSMPYNVICLTCTVVALAFGPLHNITTKNLKLIKDEPKKLKLKKILNILKEGWNKLMKREDVDVPKEEEDQKNSSDEDKERKEL